MFQVPDAFLYLTLGSSLSLPVLPASLRWLRFLLGCPPSVASLWRGLTWFFIRYWLACPHGLLCLWTPGIDHLSQVRRCSSSVPNRYVASLLWLGLLLVLVRFCYLRLPLSTWLVWVRMAVQPSHGSVLVLHPGFLFSGLVVWGAFHRVPSPLSSFGMWSPFGVISVFCHY